MFLTDKFCNRFICLILSLLLDFVFSSLWGLFAFALNLTITQHGPGKKSFGGTGSFLVYALELPLLLCS